MHPKYCIKMKHPKRQYVWAKRCSTPTSHPGGILSTFQPLRSVSNVYVIQLIGAAARIQILMYSMLCMCLGKMLCKYMTLLSLF
ncbi:ubiquitin-like modifier-activating enzyme ATG7 [Platysternon megacephalum]|uniref:Ubiquitin-like modifier-activating enzyme ATG7 n=1 Tax=Platysternon megacephalum TaxID=55544 RepID=A0A4D9F2L6_9SAUR|nr:ubiquitin-like modifier-activating enzyme ATG7 [Platysternon megacephalum]